MISKNKQFSADLEAVGQSLEAWRRKRQPRDRIPEALWAKMTELGRNYGISPVSAALRVEYYALKERVNGSSQAICPSPTGRPTFIELKPLPTSQTAVCQVELEDRSGSKMTLRLDPGSGVDALALVQAFWRRGA